MPREAAEEAKDAVVATAATAGADAGAGLDMFADNVDADMFAETPKAAASAAPAKKALLDNYDDAEGYYNFQVQCFLFITIVLVPKKTVLVSSCPHSECSQNAVIKSQLQCLHSKMS